MSELAQNEPLLSRSTKRKMKSRTWVAVQSPVSPFRPFLSGREFRLLVQKSEIYALDTISRNELYKRINLEYIYKYKSIFRSMGDEQLRNYSNLLKADYEEWSTYGGGLASYVQAIGMVLISGVVGYLFHEVGDRLDADLRIAVGALLGLLAVLLTPMLLWRTRKLAAKKSKARLFIELIEEIVGERGGKE